jgi:Flp pilus assembly protein CpaB
LARAARVGRISLTLRSAADAGWNEGQAFANDEALDEVDSGGRKVMIYRSNQVEAGGS